MLDSHPVGNAIPDATGGEKAPPPSAELPGTPVTAQQEIERLSIVIIVVDALRADCAPYAEPSPHLSALGLVRPDLPAMTELVDGAVNFTQAIACAPYTPAAHASLFTGLLPPEHGIRSWDLRSLSHETRTLAEILTQAGYATCAMTDYTHLLPPMGLLRGFGAVVTDESEALAWWKAYEGSPRLLFLHLSDVHKPYGMPFGQAYRASYATIVQEWEERLRQHGITLPGQEEFRDEDEDRANVIRMQDAWENARGFKAGIENYLDGLQRFDRGRLRSLIDALKSVGILDTAMLIVTADHGEGRVQGMPRLNHGTDLFDDQIRIPFFLKAPGYAAPRTVSEQVSQADITPTILDVLGLLAARTRPLSDFNGRSLLPLMMGLHLPDRAAYAEVWLLDWPSSMESRRQALLSKRPWPMRAVAQGAILIARQRVLRYSGRKFWLAGEAILANDEMLQAPVESFIATLYRGLLGRLETPAEVDPWLAALQQDERPDKEKRRSTIQVFLDSEEFRSLHKYAMYDLEEDPLEMTPRDPRLEPSGWIEYGRQLEIIMDINRHARAGEPVQINATDEEIVQKRLRDLGYIE